MKSRVLFVLGISLISALLSGAEVPKPATRHDSISPEDVIRDFVRAMAMCDDAALNQVALPHAELKVLTSGTAKVNPAKVGKIISGMRIEQTGVGKLNGQERLEFRVDFGGEYIPTYVQKTDTGWKVDPRWWIAMKKPADEVGRIARHFMMARMKNDANAITQLVVDNPDIWVLSAGPSMPGGDLDVYCELAQNMPTIHLAPGDHYFDLNHAEQTVTDKEVGKDAILLYGLFGFTEIPFRMVRTPNGWRMDAADHIAMIKKKLPADKQQKAKKEYVVHLQESQVMNSVVDGNIEELQSLLKGSLPSELKNQALMEAITAYWINNQRGELPPKSKRIQVVQVLLDSGADIEAKNISPITPLMMAVRCGNGHNLELIELLIQKGADTNARDQEGETVLDLCRPEYKDYRALLVKAGAKRGKKSPTTRNATIQP